MKRTTATVLGKDGQCVLLKHCNVYCRVHCCHLMKKKEMSFDYTETSEIDSKNTSIQRRLPDNDFDGENDNECVNMEIHMEMEKDGSSDIDHDSDEECQIDESTVSDKECHKVRYVSNGSPTTADEVKGNEVNSAVNDLEWNLEWSTIKE